MSGEQASISDDELIYFNHIPKTAGTSFRNSLERVFSPAEYNNYWFADEYLSDTTSNIRSYRLLSGHFSMIPPAITPRPHRILTFLRQPEMRAFSHYLHVKTDVSSPWRFMLEDMSFEDFLFSPIAEAELLSFQARFLGLASPRDYFEVKDRPLDRNFLTERYKARSLLEEAKRTLERAWFVGVTENYTNSVNQLSYKIGVPLDASARLNVARVTTDLPELSPAAQDRLSWLNEFDHELYQFALAQQGEAAEYQGTLTPNEHFFKPHIDFRNGFVGGSWHPPEVREGRGYCWSSTKSPWVAFLAPWRGASVLTARVATWIAEDLISLKVLANGQEIPMDFSGAAGSDGSNFMYLTGTVPADLQNVHGLLNIQFELPRTVRPSIISADSDDRDLGLYANWIRLVPAVGFHQ